MSNWKDIALLGGGIYGMLGFLGAGLFGRDEKQIRLEEIRKRIAWCEAQVIHYTVIISANARVIAMSDATDQDKREYGMQIRQCKAIIDMHNEEVAALAEEAKGLAAEIEKEKAEKKAEEGSFLHSLKNLRARNDELQSTIERLHAGSITAQVSTFMAAFGQAFRTATVGYPRRLNAARNDYDNNPEAIELRGKLVFDEAIELCEALGLLNMDFESTRDLVQELRGRMKMSSRPLDMVAIADAFADIDYVVEGGRLTFGIPREPIAAVVHAANMRKADGPVSPEGKKLKPEGWVGPEEEIKKILIEHGWEP